VLNPIRLLSESDLALADRDEARAFVPEVGLPNDEVGDLVRMRNSRVRAIFGYQRELEERTKKLQEMISEIEHISYAIVHDMRAPLRAMQGFATLLESDDFNQTPEERRSYLQKISGAAVRLDQLIQDVLTYNRTVLRRAPLHPVDTGLILQGILHTYPAFAPETANIETVGPMPVVIGNEALLTQCFSNLIENAVKFSRPGTPPRVRIWSETPTAMTPADHLPVAPFSVRAGNDTGPSRVQFVRIWIEDNGTGIPKEAQSRIFTMFQRLTDDQRGTGLGLAIVRKVVEQMGGQIGVESEAGKGSRFWINLELASCGDGTVKG
jgi:signal transduction histidine kinase